MARYWVFQNNQVVGPHEVEELGQLAGFGPESLVCPEGRKGTNMGDWQRASMLPELSVSLVKATQVAVAAGPPGGGVYSALPPEPTLKDLAALGSLQEKVSYLDATVVQLQETLRLKDNELLSLHQELDEKGRQTQDLSAKLSGLEERLTSVGSMQQNLDKAVAAEQDVEGAVQRQAKVIDDLTREIERLKAEQQEIERLKQELEHLKSRPAAAAPESEPAPMLAPAPSEPGPSFSAQPLGEMPPLAAAATEPSPSVQTPPAGSLFAPEPAPLASSGLPSFSATAQPALEPPPPIATPLFDPTATSAPTPEPAPMPVSDGPSGLLGAAPLTLGASSFNPVGDTPAIPMESVELARKPKGRWRRSLFLMITASMLFGAYYEMKTGMLTLPAHPIDFKIPPALLKLIKNQMTGRSKPSSAPAFSEPASSEPPSASPASSDDQLEARRQAAVELVRGWPTPGGRSVGAQLAGAMQPSGLSPWMAESVQGDLFQVNFFSSKPSGGDGQTYEFLADLAGQKVTGRNSAAQNILAGKAPRRGARGKRNRDASGEKPLLEDLLKAPDDSSAEPTPQAPPSKPIVRGVKRRKAPLKGPSLDEMLQGGNADNPKPEGLDQMLLPSESRHQAVEEPEAKPSEAAGPAKAKGAQGADAQLLDDLLKQ